MKQILVSLSSDVAQKVRHALLMSDVFGPWRNHPESFKVSQSFPAGERHAAGVDIAIRKIPNVDLPNPRQIDVDAAQQSNNAQKEIHIISGQVSSGGPDGGTIRFFYRET